MNKFLVASSLILGLNSPALAQESDNTPSNNEANQVVAINAEFVNTVLSSQTDEELSDDDRKEKWRKNTETLAKNIFPGATSLKGGVRGIAYELLNIGNTKIYAGVYRMDETAGSTNLLNIRNNTTNVGLVVQIPLFPQKK